MRCVVFFCCFGVLCCVMMYCFALCRVAWWRVVLLRRVLRWVVSCVDVRCVVL